MQRYGALAAKSLANTCVPLSDEETSGLPSNPALPSEVPEGTSTGDPGSTPFDGESSGDETTGDETTGGPDTPPSLTTDTTTAGTTTDDPSAGVDEGTTDQPEPGCIPLLFDDFDDGAIGPQWSSWTDAGADLEESGSIVQFSLVGEAVGGTDSGLISVDLFDLTEGQTRIKVAEHPTPDSPMRLYVQWLTDSCTLTIIIESDQIHALGSTSNVGHDATWFQMRSDGALVHAERSIDGVVWEPIVPPQPLECDLSQTQVLAFGGAGGPSSAGPTAALQMLEVCGPTP
ncbi:MAG: hypothetical protein AAGF11_08270 [Myxococcota bacterium]